MKGCAFRLVGEVEAHFDLHSALFSCAIAEKHFKKANDKAGVRGIRILIKEIRKKHARHYPHSALLAEK